MPMNSRTLAGVSVIVALLCGLLVISLAYSLGDRPPVTVEVQPEAADLVQRTAPADAYTGSASVSASVKIQEPVTAVVEVVSN